MADPKLREQLAKERQREDEISRRDHHVLGPSPSPRMVRGMLPGGRMYGEDDSVVAYFAGHAMRGLRALGRVVSRKRGADASGEDLRESIEYKDYDPD